MIKIGDRVIFNSKVDPDDAYLNGSVVKVLAKDDYMEEELEFEEEMVLIEFEDGTTMDVEIHELSEIIPQNGIALCPRY